MTGLQVIDSHGMIVGRIRKVVPTESGGIRLLVIAVDKEPLRTSLNNPGISDEVEVSHDKVIAIGEVAILSDVFSFSLLTERPSRVGPQNRRCPGCGAVIFGRREILYGLWKKNLGLRKFTAAVLTKQCVRRIRDATRCAEL